MLKAVDVAEIDGTTDFSEWNAFIAGHPSGTYALTTGWAEAVRRTYRHRAWLVKATRDSRLTGGATVVELRCPGRIVYATGPFASAAPLVAEDPADLRLIAARIVAMANEGGAQYLEIKGGIAPAGFETNDEYAIHEVQLGPPDVMWKATIERRCRDAVKQARKAGLTVSWDVRHVPAWLRVLNLKLRQLGTPAHSAHFVPNIVATFGRDAHVGVVLDATGRVCAGILMLVCGKRASIVYSASLPGTERLRPNNILWWEAMCRCHTTGCERLDFGRSIGDGGGVLFKRSFGATGSPLPYAYHLGRASSIPRLHQGNPRLRLARRIWSRLPLAVANRLGPRLIRCIP